MILALALGWWFLTSGTSSSNIPAAAGPYPSAEFCRLAAHAMMPREPQFMTEGELAAFNAANERKAAADKKQREEQDAMDAPAIAKLKAGPRIRRQRFVTLPSGRQVYVNATGKVDDTYLMGTFSVSAVSFYIPDPLAGCTEIK